MEDRENSDAVARRLLKIAADRLVRDLAEAARRRALEIINNRRPEAEQHADPDDRQ